ncbi:tetratricopeptide repeat protein [Myroides fluvii]|uniref:tetratricopeptide repeat protein n=1 Tax=Myroides fluvii TaxID=2572594 RepID=UPI00131E8B48|nr:tetratricopeptide repeat protein [Myroides fluvii]
MFHSTPKEEAYLPLVAGLILAPAVITLPFSTKLQQPDYFVYLPIPAIVFTLGLGIYIFLARKKGAIAPDIRSIFYRGLVISIISSFFLYTPESFKPYRKVLLALNNGNTFISNNILMMDNTYESEAAIDENNCDIAISFALKANQYARLLVEKTEMEEQNFQTREFIFHELLKDNIEDISIETIQMLYQYEGEEHLYPISRTYSTLFKAYFCKAETLYSAKQYKEALSHYVQAYKYLTIPTIKSIYWQEQKSDALNMIGHCYRQLNKIDLAGYFYVSAFDNYSKATNKTEIDLTSASYIGNMAFMVSAQNGFTESNQILEMINTALLKEKQTPEHSKIILNNYQGQIYNYLAIDSLQQVFTYITKAQELVEKNSTLSCSIQLSLAYYQFKSNLFKQAETTIKDCIRCFEEAPSSNKLKGFEAQSVLGQIQFALGQFEEAKEQLTLVLDVIEKSRGKTNELYAYDSNILGDLNKVLGHYSLAAQNYQTALDLYNSGQIMQTHNIPLVLAGLSDLALLQGNLVKAQLLIDESLDIASTSIIPNSVNMATLYSHAAHVAYHRGNLTTADTLYQKVVLIADSYNLSTSLLKANSLNGLGLVEMNRKNYSTADQHFRKSLLIHQNIVSDQSPYTAQVYLNYGILNLREGKLTEAQTKLHQALKINQQFFKADHPIFGDLHVAFGDLAHKQGQAQTAQVNYTKALGIYTKYFNDTHWKIKEVQQKLK